MALPDQAQRRLKAFDITGLAKDPTEETPVAPGLIAIVSPRLVGVDLVDLTHSPHKPTRPRKISERPRVSLPFGAPRVLKREAWETRRLSHVEYRFAGPPASRPWTSRVASPGGQRCG